MGGTFDHILLSRIQFALTAMFHVLWPVFTIGASLFLVVLEALWVKTAKEIYYRHARFWSNLFVLNVAVAIATGIPMEFQFGTNWSPFSRTGGDFLGNMLGFEAAMAFMLDAAFISIMIFGWKRVSARMHLFATSMVALGASVSAFWIMAANSWMHTPAGGYFKEGKFIITSNFDAIFNPDMYWSVSHMWAACMEISVFCIGGISAWYILKKRHTEFFLVSFKMAVIAAIVITPLQIFLGDGAGRSDLEYQPAKLAAMELHWRTNAPGEGAPFSIAAWPDTERERNRWSIEIPYALSVLATHTLTGKVKGLREIAPEDRPPLVVNYYAFRIMVASGVALFLLMLWTLRAWWKNTLTGELAPGQKSLLYSWIVAIPLSYLAMESGWVLREVGRQPWVVYGLLRTSDSASTVPAGTVAFSLAGFTLLYATFLTLFLAFARNLIRKGPDLETPVQIPGLKK